MQKSIRINRILKPEVIWLTGRIEKEMSTQDLMLMWQHENGKYALTKQKSILKKISESEDNEEITDEKETNEIIYEKLTKKDKIDK